MMAVAKLNLSLSTLIGNAKLSAWCSQANTICAGNAGNGDFLAIRTQVSQGFETRLLKERLTPPGSGGGLKVAIGRRMSAISCLEMATSAFCKAVSES